MNDPFVHWSVGPHHPVLAEGDVHVWGWKLAGTIDDLTQVHRLLSTDEVQRTRSFRFGPDAERYARSRAGLRRILAAYLEVDAAGVRFVYGKYGKPALDGTPLEFNLSHTQAMAVAVFSTTGPVGIDVEELRPVAKTLGEPVFSVRELATLQAIEDEHFTRAFFNGWTRKEAVCKAEGLGFHLPPQSFSVSLGPHNLPGVDDAGGVLSRDWTLLDLPLGKAAVGCVALTARPPVVKTFCL